MKPDWKDAPEWAKYLAMDEDGDWYWFEKEPGVLTCTWWSDEGDWTPAEPAYANDWQESLEQRA